MRTVLYEIYYHDAWRTRTSYDRQHMTTNEDDAAQWLFEHLDEWYDKDNDPEIQCIVSQALDQEFTFMTINAINIYEDGSVDWDQSDNWD